MQQNENTQGPLKQKKPPNTAEQFEEETEKKGWCDVGNK